MTSPFERRRRRVARVALYGGLLAVALLGAVAYRSVVKPLSAGLEFRWNEADWEADPAVRLLQQYLRIDTTAATGDEWEAALFLATPLEAAGLEPTVERVGERWANLWAELPGRTAPPLVLLNHLDVEPVDRDEPWRHPPFGGVLDPPYVYSRGAFDMKSYAVAQLWALLAAADGGRRGDRPVRFLATSSEEAGSDRGTKWLLREHPELFDEAWAVLGEGGVVEAENPDDIRYWAIEVGQKRFVEVIFCSGDRARLEQVRTLLRERLHPLDGLSVTEPVRQVWREYAPTRGRAELRELLADPDRFLADPAAFGRLPGYLQSMLRNEAVPFGVVPAAGGGWQLRVLLHLLPGTATPAVFDELLPPWIRADLPHVVHETPPAPPSALDHPAFAAVAREIRSEYPGVPLGPYLLPWTATDARYLRGRGVPVYGFSPFPILTTDTMATGHPNERLSLPGFRRGVDLYRRLVATLRRDN